MLFIQQKYINFERFQAGVTVNMTKKAYYGGHMLSRSVPAPYPTIYTPPTPSKMCFMLQMYLQQL